MYLASLKLLNFKGFGGESQEILFKGPTGEPGSGLNILVGENNGGKSTLLKAICWLRDYATFKENIRTLNLPGDADPTSGVIGEFAANDLGVVIDDYVTEKQQNALKKKIFKKGNEDHLRIRRKWRPGTDEHKKIFVLEQGEGFDGNLGKNVTGIDAAVKACVDVNVIWADDNPQDEASMGATTLSGRLLADCLAGCQNTEEFTGLDEAFRKLFNGEGSSFKQQISLIEGRISQRFADYFGGGKLSFHFPTPEVSTLVKGMSLDVDMGVNLPLQQHGNGLQRIAGLALLTEWADMQSVAGKKSAPKPYFFILDEPEICMHPRGQNRLLEALIEISANHQVFVTTHSPLFLLSPDVKNAHLLLCGVNDQGVREVKPVTDFAQLFPWSPSWGEISWFAYKLPTVEFHNELYGYLQQLFGTGTIQKTDERILEDYRDQSGEMYQWHRDDKTKRIDNYSVHSCVRNAIHHPENKFENTKKIVEDHLKESIELLVEIVKAERQKQAASLS